MRPKTKQIPQFTINEEKVKFCQGTSNGGISMETPNSLRRRVNDLSCKSANWCETVKENYACDFPLRYLPLLAVW